MPCLVQGRGLYLEQARAEKKTFTMSGKGLARNDLVVAGTTGDCSRLDDCAVAARLRCLSYSPLEGADLIDRRRHYSRRFPRRK